MSVCIDDLSAQERGLVERDPHGVVAHLQAPHLELVGIGEEVTELSSAACQRVLKVGLLPKQADFLLRRGVRVTLSVETPSASLLAEDLLNSPRGQQLQRDALQAKSELTRRVQDLLPQIKTALQRHLDSELAQKLLSDPVLLEALQTAVTTELIDRVNWAEIATDTFASEELATLGELALRHVNGWDVARDAWKGGNQGIKETSKAVDKAYEELSEEGLTLWDASVCSFKAGLVGTGLVDPLMAPIISGLLSATKGAKSHICDELLKGPKRVVVSALKGGAKRFAQESYESLKLHGDESLSASRRLAAQAWRRAEAGTRLQTFWLAIAGNEALRQHIIAQYGEPVWRDLNDAMFDVSADAGVEQLVIQVSEEAKSLGKKALTALVLDREGKGPNPLLLSVLQEQLSGAKRPVIRMVPPPEGSPLLSEGYIFTPLVGQESQR